jgi:hypothetical protein
VTAARTDGAAIREAREWARLFGETTEGAKHVHALLAELDALLADRANTKNAATSWKGRAGTAERAYDEQRRRAERAEATLQAMKERIEASHSTPAYRRHYESWQEAADRIMRERDGETLRATRALERAERAEAALGAPSEPPTELSAKDSQQAALEAIIAVASPHDLLTNAVARAMYEYALRGLEGLVSVLVDYGCYECLRPHDGPIGLTECPHCGGFTGPMPPDEQPTEPACEAVAAWERGETSDG